MKKRSLTVIIFLFVWLLMGCGSVKSGDEVQQPPKTYLNLAEFLTAKGGVLVSGTGNNVIVQIRGMNSLQGDTRPFFYIDGVAIGRSYADANSAVNPNDIEHVRVISSLSELAIYGENGVNGIIKIETKNKD